LEEPAKRLEKEGVGQDKPGARLDSCAAYVARAERRAAAAADAVQAAETALEEARARQAELDAELAEGRARLESLRTGFSPLNAGAEGETATDSQQLLQCTRVLLQRLESGSFAATANVPPEVLDAMRAVHAAVSTVEPAPRPSLDTALEPEAVGDVASSPAPAVAAAEEATAADAPMTSADVDALSRSNEDDAAFGAAMRRRLRMSPYSR